jgi:hypothetical protein
MDTKYHSIIAVTVIRQIPQLSNFFKAQKYGDKKIREDAIRPDMVYKDSLAQTAEVHHAHSYKEHVVDGKVCWLDGDCMSRVKGLATDVRNYRMSQDYKLMCRCIGEWTHYAVDCHTYPHLVKGKPWTTYHLPWETEQAKWLESNQSRIGELEFIICKDIYKAFVKDAREMYFTALGVVANIEKGIIMTDEENLALVRKITMAVGSGLLSITQKFWPKE